MMCPHCFNKYKRSEINQQTQFCLDVLQFRFKGYSDKEKFPSELKLDQDTFLLGLPSNNQELSQQFQNDMKQSIYYQIGDYISAASTAFDSFQTVLQSSESQSADVKEDKLVLSYILIQKNQIFTMSNIPTYGLVVTNDKLHAFNKQTWNTESKTYTSTFSLESIENKGRVVQIIYGLSVLKFENNLLLSSTISAPEDQELKEKLSLDELQNNTIEFLTKYLKQFDGTMYEKNPACGFLIKMNK